MTFAGKDGDSLTRFSANQYLSLVILPILILMSKRRIGVIPGDGIGPEITKTTLAILEAVGFEAEWVYLEGGLGSVEKGNAAMPQATIDAIRELGIALKGPTTTPVGSGHKSANVILRQALDLFANVRPTKTMPGVHGPFEGKKIDLVIVRENTEDLYAGIEFQPHPDVAQSIKVITRPGCQRLFKYAFDMVRKQGRKRITAVHKANIMKLSDGMFLQLVINPEKFDVIVTENLYGDIISDLCAGLVGGLGLAASANIGKDCAVFEAVHGSAPDIAGKGIANPTALLFSALMMLRHLGEHDKADRILNAVLRVCNEGQCLTIDLGGHASTEEYQREVIRTANEMVTA